MAREYFNPDKTDALNVAIKYNGNITAIARHFNVSRETIYQWINRDPTGKEIIHKVRNYNGDFDLDLAEHVNRYNMTQYKSQPAIAQRAAEYTLNNKGQSRGWNQGDPIDNRFEESVTDIQNKFMETQALLDKYIEIHGDLNDLSYEPETEQELPGSDSSF